MPIERYQVSLKAIIRRDDGRVLALNGRIGGLFEGYYDLPGGRIEETEFAIPFPEIIRREVREEVGSELQFTLSDAPVAVGRHQARDGQRVLYVFFDAIVDNPDVTMQVSAEHVGSAWLDLSAQPLEKLFVSGILEGMKQWYTARHET
jgi:8-oxo-dGTP pyrophosphatase MutT (NUDIX family)